MKINKEPILVDYANQEARDSANNSIDILRYICWALSSITSGICCSLILWTFLSPIADYTHEFFIYAICGIVGFGLCFAVDIGANRALYAAFSELAVYITRKENVKVDFDLPRVLAMIGFFFLGGSLFTFSYITSRDGSESISKVADRLPKSVKAQEKTNALAIETKPYQDALDQAKSDLKADLVSLMGAEKYRKYINGSSSTVRAEFGTQAAAIVKKHESKINQAALNLQTVQANFVATTKSTDEQDRDFVASIKNILSKIGTAPMWIALCLIALSCIKETEDLRKKTRAIHAKQRSGTPQNNNQRFTHHDQHQENF